MTVEDAALTLTHAVELTGLTGGTYYFRVSSANASAQTVTSSNQTFTLGALFTNSFEGLAPLFGFEGLYDLRFGTWYNILPAVGQGWAGTQGARLVTFASRSQYNAGWYFHNGNLKSGGWRDGDTIYVRMRVRYDDNFRWDGAGSMQNKMVDFGMGGSGASRVILHQESPHQTTPCGLPVSDRPNFGSLSLKIGITFTCTPPVRITFGQWYHVQFAVQSSHGTTRDGHFKIWVNNNDAGAPSSQLLNIAVPTTNGGVNYWNGSMAFGGYITDAPLRNQGWVMDDFQVSDTFSPNWYPG
jgi:hypothetical protein